MALRTLSVNISIQQFDIVHKNVVEIRQIFFFRYGRFCDVTTRHFWSKIGQTSRDTKLEDAVFNKNANGKHQKDVKWEALQDGDLRFWKFGVFDP